MSAIAGIYHRDGSSAAVDVLAAVSRRLAAIGPDDEQFVARGAVAMAHRRFETFRAGQAGHFLTNDADGTVIAFDGRLDNRRELLGQVEGASPADSDPQIVAKAYRQHGLKGLARCIGDFALALWNGRERRLLLCCDGMGRRPLFYRVTRETVLWASSARALVEGARLSPALDEEHIADFLCNRASAHSAFSAVTRLPGGHALIVTPEKSEIVQYWTFDPNRTLRYRDDRDYEHHFSELFQDAVACRLASDSPVFSELSGGVDSSAVTCVANPLTTHGTTHCRELRAVSYVYDLSPSSDERPFMQTVETFLGKPSFHVMESEHEFTPSLGESVQPDAPTNGLRMLALNDRVTAAMRASGSRVILSGLGGDQVLNSQPNVAVLLADLIVERRFGRLLREAVRWSRFLKLPLPELLAEAARIAASTQFPDKGPPPALLDRGFVARVDFRARRRRLAPDAAAYRLPTAAQQCHATLNAMRPYALEPCSTLGYVDRRYPFLDRRVAEFALAIPGDQKLRLGESRSILRRGLKGLVPNAVLQRRTKAGPSEAFMRALMRQRQWWAALLQDARVCAHGLMDRTALNAAIARTTHGDLTDHQLLLRSLSLELWLRTLEERSSGFEATAPPGWRDRQMEDDSHGTEQQGQQHGGIAGIVRSA